MKERQQFVEMFYGQQTGYDVAIDFSRKAGPLSRMTQILNREARSSRTAGRARWREAHRAVEVRVDGHAGSLLAAAAAFAAGSGAHAGDAPITPPVIEAPPGAQPAPVQPPIERLQVQPEIK